MRLAIVLLLAFSSVAHADAVDDFDAGEARASRLKLRTMDVLLAGGIVSTITGAGLMATDRYDQGLRIAGGLTAGFGVVNLILGGIAIPSVVNAQKRFVARRASRETPQGLFDAQRAAIAEQHADAILFGVNLGLDGAYVLAGHTAVLASQLGVDHPDRWLGGGLAAVIQGVFLVGVDLTGMTIANRRHRKLLETLAGRF